MSGDGNGTSSSSSGGSNHYLLQLEPIPSESPFRQPPTALQLRQGQGSSSRQSFAGGNPGELVLGRGNTTCIFDPQLPEDLVALCFDDFAALRGWVKATLLKHASVRVNGQPWTPRNNNNSNNKRRREQADQVHDHRYLRHGDVISLLDGDYAYRVGMYPQGSRQRQQQQQQQAAPSRAPLFQEGTSRGSGSRSSAARLGPPSFSAGTSEHSQYDPIVAQAVAAHLFRRQGGQGQANDAAAARTSAGTGQQPSPAVRALHPSTSPQDEKAQQEKAHGGQDGDVPNTTQHEKDGSTGSEAETKTVSTGSCVSISTKAMDRLQDDVQCSVCLEIQVHSHTLVPCGHSFCAPCIGIHGDSNIKSCPNCRQAARQKIPCRQLDALVATLVQVPGLLNQDDVQHYHKRNEEYQKKVDAARLKAASAKRPAKRARIRQAPPAAAQMPRLWRTDRRRGALEPVLPEDFMFPAPPSETANAVNNANNSSGSGHGRPRGNPAASSATARTTAQQAQDFENLFRDADMDLFRHRAWGAPVAASSQRAQVGQGPLLGSIAAAAAHAQQAQHQADQVAAAVASANRGGYMLAPPPALYPGRANPYLSAPGPAAAAAPRYLDDVTLAALFPGSDAIFID